MTDNILNAPEGMKSYLPEDALKFAEIRKNIDGVFRCWGYQPVITPLLENYDSLLAGMEEEGRKQFYKMIDYDGNILALRPEMTAPIARTVVNREEELSLPLRLSYYAPVFRYDMPQTGKNREIFQMGLEFIGESSFADAEVIITAVEAIKSTGIKDFKIDLGHVGYLQGIIEQLKLPADKGYRLKTFLHEKDFVGLRSFLKKLTIGNPEVLHNIPLLRGDKEILERAEQMVDNRRSLQAVTKLKEVYQYLESYRIADFINFDFSLIRGLDYYTGMIFEGFTEKLGYTICGGGRYDNLLGQYGSRSIPAVGFAIGVQRLALALENYPETENKLDGLLIFAPERRGLALQCARQLHHQEYHIIIEENGNSRESYLELARRKGAARVLFFDKITDDREQQPAVIEVVDVKDSKEAQIELTEGWEKKIWDR